MHGHELAETNRADGDAAGKLAARRAVFAAVQSFESSRHGGFTHAGFVFTGFTFIGLAFVDCAANGAAHYRHYSR